MKAIEQLRRIKKLEVQIDNRLAEIEKIDSNIKSITTTLGEFVTGSSSPDKLQEAIIKLETRKDSLNDFIDYYNNERDSVLRTVEKLPNPNHIAVLYKRYFEHKRWEVISVEMHYAFRHTLKLHRQALDSYNEVFMAKNKAQKDI